MMSNDYSPYEKLLELEVGYLKIGHHQEEMARQMNQNAQVFNNLTEQFQVLMAMVKEQQEHIEYLDEQLNEMKG